ncbi:MAG TPA: hypothetical protein VJ917_08730 [Saprospiraceae bacterium]|nr:hypothetical protein [Saprospiraceae bacterium]
MKLRGIVLIFSFCFLFFGLNAQVALNAWYHVESMEVITLQDGTQLQGPDLNSLNMAFSYEWALEDYRVQFHPSLYYGQSVSKVEITEDLQIDQVFLGVALPVRFYLLDFEGDCNCPTFSKSSNFFSKGFFFEAAGFYQLVKQNLNVSGGEQDLQNFGASIGLGLDIGLSDHWTVTFHARTGQWFKSSVTDENIDLLSFEDASTGFYQIGLSLTYYWTHYY